MALAYRAGSFVSAGNANGGDLTINKPTGTADGDIMVTVIYWEPDTTTISTVPTGWTRAATIANTGAFLLEIWYKRASGEGTSYTWGNSTAGNQWRTIVSAAYSGGTGTGSLIDITGASQADGQLDANQTAPSVTTTGTDRMLIYGYGNYGGATPSGANGAANNFRGQLGGVMIADALRASAGATGTTNETGAGTQDYAAAHVAIISDTGGAAGAIPPGLIIPRWRRISRRVYR